MTKLLAALTALALLGAGCSDGGEEPSSVATTVAADDPDDPRSVYPLPSGDIAVVSPYTEVDDEELCTETVIFSVTGPGVDVVMLFYDRLLTNMGYLVDEVDADAGAGTGAVAVEITDPAADDTTGIIQVEPDGDGSLRLIQERITLKG